jgi:hypothetical protein
VASRIIRIAVPWTWVRILVFVFIEAVLLVVYYFQPRDLREGTLFGATIVAGAFALYSYLRGIDDRRTQEAGRMIARWNAPDRVKARNTMHQITEGQIDPFTLQRTSKGTKIDGSLHGARIDVVSSLNFYEELAISVFDGAVDEDTVFSFSVP